VSMCTIPTCTNIFEKCPPFSSSFLFTASSTCYVS
jgi:hypothetical protein